MERSKIPMLNRFDTISHIMRYYASTHKAFLLLSSLCSDTRAKLDEYYNEFIWCMEGNWTDVNLNLDSNNFLIPFDLFKIGIIFAIDESSFNTFIQFINQLKNPFGIQFQNHLFNSHIKINSPILIESSWIEKLYPYIDDLKSIQVFQSNNLSQPTSLDTISSIIFNITPNWTKQ